jgi:membrane fusion protein, multidrug efflux system
MLAGSTLRLCCQGAVVAIMAAMAGPSLLSAQGAPTPTVTVSQPVSKRVTQWDEFSGRFVALDNVEVRPRVSGFIEKIHFKDGDMVDAGALLFTIDQRPFEIALAAAEAEMANAKSQVKLQLADVKRAQGLEKKQLLATSELEKRQASLSTARAQVQAAKAAIRSAKLDLEWTEVRAPISGRLSDAKVDVGALVTGGAATTTLLTTIVRLDPIYFVFEGSESDYLRYVRASKNGERPSSRTTANPVRIKLSDEKGWPWTGKMEFVDNQLDASSGTIRARAIVENKDQFLAPGLFGRLQLFGGEFDALLVPDKAVVSDQTQKIIFVVNDEDTVEARPVELGAMSGGLRVIKTGLSKGDRVVINGIANPMVRPGAKVKPEAGAIEPAEAG